MQLLCYQFHHHCITYDPLCNIIPVLKEKIKKNILSLWLLQQIHLIFLSCTIFTCICNGVSCSLARSFSSVTLSCRASSFCSLLSASAYRAKCRTFQIHQNYELTLNITLFIHSFMQTQHALTWKAVSWASVFNLSLRSATQSVRSAMEVGVHWVMSCSMVLRSSHRATQ